MRAENELVGNAVIQTSTTRGQSYLQKLFAFYFDAFVYNQIWEDPRVDLQALNLDENSRVLTISSGGCNALNYLLESPAKVTAVDLNRHHIFLLDLKIAALKALDYDNFFAFFGHGRSDRAVEIFDRSIAAELNEKSRDHWSSKTLSGRRRIEIFTRGGLYDHSRNGYFLRFFQKFARLVGSRPEKVLEARSFDEQSALFDQHIAPFYDSLIIKFIGRLPVTLFGLGIPPQQFDELLKDVGDGGNVVDVLRERTRRLAVDYPIDENYFAWQAFARKYDTEKLCAVPDYLKRANFETLRENVSNLETVIGSVTDVIRDRPGETFNRFVFLDAQDWMNAATMTELWSLIAEKGERGSRIIFRTAGSSSPIENNLPPEVRSRFVYEEESSRELFKQDRASIYGGFHVYELGGGL